MLVAGLAAGVAGFFIGWLIFGILLMDYMGANINSYDGLMRTEMDLGALFAGNLLSGLLVAWVAWRAGDTNAVGGFRTGAILGLLIYAGFALYYYSMMNWYINSSAMVVDVLANTVWLALMGLVAGLILGLGRKAA